MNLSTILGRALDKFRKDEPFPLPSGEVLAIIPPANYQKPLPLNRLFTVLTPAQEALGHLEDLSLRRTKETTLKLFRPVTPVTTAVLETVQFVHQALLHVPDNLSAANLMPQLIQDGMSSAMGYLSAYGMTPRFSETSAKAAFWAGVGAAYSNDQRMCAYYVSQAQSNDFIRGWLFREIDSPQRAGTLMKSTVMKDAIQGFTRLAI